MDGSSYTSNPSAPVSYVLFAGGVMEDNQSTLQGGAIAVGGRDAYFEMCLPNEPEEIEYLDRLSDEEKQEVLEILERTKENVPTIRNNTAGTNAGAMYVNSSFTYLHGGLIENNYSDNYGGAIYISVVPVVARVKDVLIVDNNARFIGGGIWTCPSGATVFEATEGIAVFDNKANRAGDDFATVQEFSYYTQQYGVSLSERMLGGGLSEWHEDGKLRQQQSSYYGVVDGNAPRYDKFEPGEIIKLIGYRQNMSLINTASEGAKLLAQNHAKLIIQNNNGYVGGGIAMDGTMIVHSTPIDEYKIKVLKVFDEKTPDEAIPQTIEVELIIHDQGVDYQLDTIELTKENNWESEFIGLPPPATLSDDTKYYVKEIAVDGINVDQSAFQASMVQKESMDGGKTFVFEITNTYSAIEIKKTWEVENEDLLPDEIEVVVKRRVKDSGSEWENFEDNKVTLKKEEDWKHTKVGLDAYKITYHPYDSLTILLDEFGEPVLNHENEYLLADGSNNPIVDKNHQQIPIPKDEYNNRHILKILVDDNNEPILDDYGDFQVVDGENIPYVSIGGHPITTPSVYDKGEWEYKVVEEEEIYGFYWDEVEGTKDNDYTLHNIQMKPYESDFPVTKTITGRDFAEDAEDSFHFALIPEDVNNPMPEGTTSLNNRPAKIIKIDGTDETSEKIDEHIRKNAFGNIIYREEGTFRYTIYEMMPSEAGDANLPGMSYSTERYNVVVKVEKNAEGTEFVGTTTITKVNGNQANIANFTNVFDKDMVRYNLVSQKTYRDDSKQDPLTDRKFAFKLLFVEKLDKDNVPDPNANPKLPTPTSCDPTILGDTDGQGRNTSCVAFNEGTTVYFEREDASDAGLTFKSNNVEDDTGTYVYALSELVEVGGTYYALDKIEDLIQLLNMGAIVNDNGTLTLGERTYDMVIHERKIIVGKNEEGILSVHAERASGSEPGTEYDHYLKPIPNGDGTYTFEHTEVDIEHTDTNVPIFRNVYAPVRDISGKKIWIVADEEDVKDFVLKFKIQRKVDGEWQDVMRNGEVYTVETSLDDNWEYTFTNLQHYEESTSHLDAGKEVEYRVVEVEVPEGYTTENGTKENNYNVTNEGSREISFIKAWDDANDNDGKRPDSITVQLIANDEKIVRSIEAKKEDNYSGTFKNVPILDRETKERITYSIREVFIPSYGSPVITVVEGSVNPVENVSKYQIENKHTPELVTISGSKMWADNFDENGLRPEKITVRLYADGVEVSSKVVRKGQSGDLPNDFGNSTWTFEFKDLPKYKDGKEIKYTVTEDGVDGYHTEIKDFEITNHTYTEIPVEKVWDDNENAEKVRPDSIVVRLYANGQETSFTLTLTKDNNYQGVFEDLLKYDEVNERIQYTVKEDSVPKYTLVSITGSMDEGYVIKNKLTPPEEPEEPKKPKKDKPKEPVPNTGV